MTAAKVSEFQVKVLASIPFVAAPLSFLGSSIILFIILTKRPGKNTNPTYLRLMLGICTYDILMTTWAMMGPIPVPKTDASNGIINLAQGTVASCTAQGFFIYLGAIGTLFYNSSLMGFYLASIVFEFCSQDLVKLEFYLHIISIGLPLAMQGIGLYLQIFNPTLYSQRCGIAPYPLACAKDPSIPCTRGSHFDLYVTYAIAVPCMIGLLLILICLLWIYVFARRQSLIVSDAPPSQKKQNPVIKILHCLRYREQNNELETESNDSIFSVRSDTIRAGQNRHHAHHRSRNQPKYVRAVAIQSMIYAIVFFNTYFWVFVRYFMRKSDKQALLFSIRFFAELFLPLQGFCNAIIFLRPRYNNIKKQHKDRCTLWIIKESILATPQVLPSSRRRKSNRLSSASFRLDKASVSIAVSKRSNPLNPHLEVCDLKSDEICPDEMPDAASVVQSYPGTHDQLPEGQHVELPAFSKSNNNDPHPDGENDSDTANDYDCEGNNQLNLVVITVKEEELAIASSLPSMSHDDCNLEDYQSQRSDKETNFMQEDDTCSEEHSDDQDSL